MKCDKKQCWCLVTASNNLSRGAERVPGIRFVLMECCWRECRRRSIKAHVSGCFSHRFAVCCNLVRCMSHCKPWNKSSKLWLGIPLCRAGICSAACSSTGSLALLWCLTILHDESSLCGNVSLEIGNALQRLADNSVSARNVQKKKKAHFDKTQKEDMESKSKVQLQWIFSFEIQNLCEGR